MNFDDVPVVRNEKKFDDIVQEALKGGDPQLLVPPKSIAKDVLKETTGNVYAMSGGQILRRLVARPLRLLTVRWRRRLFLLRYHR